MDLLLTGRCCRGQEVLLSLAGRRALRNWLEQARCVSQCQVRAWVFLPEHFHALLYLPERERVSAMRALMQPELGNCRMRWRLREASSASDLQLLTARLHADPVFHGWAFQAFAWPWSSVHDIGPCGHV